MLTLTKVKSANVDAVDYLEDDGVLLVRYRDGSLYARPGVSKIQHYAIVSADSIGQAVARMSQPSICINRGHGASAPQGTASQPAPRPVMTVEDLRRVQQQQNGAGDDSSFAIVQRR